MQNEPDNSLTIKNLSRYLLNTLVTWEELHNEESKNLKYISSWTPTAFRDKHRGLAHGAGHRSILIAPTSYLIAHHAPATVFFFFSLCFLTCQINPTSCPCFAVSLTLVLLEIFAWLASCQSNLNSNITFLDKMLCLLALAGVAQ